MKCQGACKPGSVPPKRGQPFIWAEDCSPAQAANPDFSERSVPAPVKGHEVPIWPCSGWGLPCGDCRQPPGALLPHPFTLAPTSGAVCSLWHCPYGFPRRALPATLTSWSPDFPRIPCGNARLPGPLARPHIGTNFSAGKLARDPAITVDQELEQDGADLSVDIAVDLLRSPAALERLDRLVAVGHVIAETFKRQVKSPVIVEWIAQLELAAWAGTSRIRPSGPTETARPDRSCAPGRHRNAQPHWCGGCHAAG